MDLLQHIQEWAEGELMQAKIMIVISIMLLIATFFLYKSDNEMVNGMLIPMGLTIIVLLGYGGFMFQDRNKRISKIENEYEQTSAVSISKEERKIEEGIASCKITIRVWYALIVVGICLFFFFNQPYYKGVGLGVAFLGIAFLLMDVSIDKRAKKLYAVYIALE